MHPSYDPAKVMAAVQRTLQTPKKPLTQIAEEAGLTRSIVNQARVVVLYGTKEEIELLSTGTSGLKSIYKKVKAHLTEEQKAELGGRRFAGLRSEKFMTLSDQDAALWGAFGPTLKSLTTLPSPKDMLGVVLRNRGREGSVKAFLTIATEWLMEFEHEWASHQRGKPKKDTSDA